MIRLSRRREPQSIPADFKGANLVAKHLDLIDRYFDAAEAGKPMAFVASKWKSAKARVRAESDKKCAYCEASTSTVAHGDVEHFRPKSIYWWLAYHFDNYLFACQICNQIYKGDNFPVANGALLSAPTMPALRPGVAADLDHLATLLSVDCSTVTDAQVIAALAGEDADLVNPYFEDPEPLISYEVDDSNGEVWIRPVGNDRAQRFYEAANKYLGLNREELRRDRYVFFEHLLILKISYEDPSLSQNTKKLIERQFAKCREAKFPFAGMHRHFLSSWGIE